MNDCLVAAIKYVKDVGDVSYESSKGYSNEGIDLRSCEYFRRLNQKEFDFPAPSIRNDVYIGRRAQYESRPNYQRKLNPVIHTQNYQYN